MAERIGAVRVVRGDDWIADGRTGRPTQDAEWYLLRRTFYDGAARDGWRIIDDVQECTEFDEEAREVKLWIGATGIRREVFVGPPAGRDRFA